MSIETTRRALLATALAWGGVVSRRLESKAAAGQRPIRPRAGQQDSNPLAIALLDDHWQALEPLAKQFTETSGIEIMATALNYDDLYGQVSLALTQRASTFDTVFLVDPWIPQFASFLAPIELSPSLVDAPAPVAIDLSRYPEAGRTCAMPWLGEIQFFVLRTDWLANAGQPPPENWDETVEATTAVAAGIDPENQLAAFGSRTRTGHDLVESFLPILRGYGKDLIDPNTSVPQLDTEPALAAMKTFLALVGYGPIESVATGEPSNAERFIAGQISMMANFWSSDLLAASAIDASADAGPIASKLQPSQPGLPRQAMTGIWLAGIPVGSVQPELARAFVDWVVSEPIQRLLPGVGLPPVRLDVLNDRELVTNFPELATVSAMLERATPRPRSPFYPQLEQLLATELQNALSGNVSGSDALRNANVAIRQFLVREGVIAS